jgi:uncharacterized YccA/Bax inhibitor family protein
MRSSNPIFKNESFKGQSLRLEESMTQRGTYIKTAVLLALCVFAASFTFKESGQVFMWPGLIGGLIFCLITVFKKQWSPVTAPLYALCEGLFLGAISYIYYMQGNSIVQNAIMLTFAVMAVMLLLYSNNIIKVTGKLRKGIMISTLAIGAVYLVSMIMGFFGTSIPMIHDAGPVGIGFSLVVVGIASFNLLLDFDFIEKASESENTPKYMEWYGAFGLMVTLVWLYLELLRLLSKLNRR